MNFRPGAVMLLLFDIAIDVIVEHDDWHTHEHLPERLAIPGFVRGSRWIGVGGAPRYFVIYEVSDLATLNSTPYLERLEHPTPWTSKMMKSYVGMRRALCEVLAGFGAGLGSTALLIRFAADADRISPLRNWLVADVLPALVKRPGIVSARIFADALEAGMTREQQIRGRDAGMQQVLLVTGYEANVVAALARNELSRVNFIAHGALLSGDACGVYHNAMTLTASDAECITTQS
jgi:hypothetical protein